MESLIGAVRLHQCLWNPLHTDYRDTNIKEAAWQSVVKAVNHNSIPNVKMAKLEWRRLRDNHRDALKRAKLGRNKLLPAQITTWKYAKNMQFLEPYMKYRITENIEVEPVKPRNQFSFDQDVSTTEVTGKQNENHLVLASKRPRVENASTSKVVYADPMPQLDALDAFFNCIRQSTREMPQWLQTSVKKKIFSVIIDAEELLASRAASSAANVSPCRNDDATQDTTEITIKNEFLTDDDEDYIH